MSDLTDRLVPLVRPLAMWVRLGGIVSLAGGSLSLIIGAFVLADMPPDAPPASVFIGVPLNAIMALGSLALGVVLLRYADRLTAMAATGDIAALIEGAAHEKTYWQIAVPLTVVWILGQFIVPALSIDAESTTALIAPVSSAIRQAASDQPVSVATLMLYLLGSMFAVVGVGFAVDANKN